MSGPPPKPAHLRQRTNRKAGAVTLPAERIGEKSAENADRPPHGDSALPEIPNPDGRTWHPLTVLAWEHAWTSPMASQWLETDMDALGRWAVLVDDFNRGVSPADRMRVMAEIRLQEQRFGLSPLDRSRLQWEVSRASDAEQKEQRSRELTRKRTGTHDPRRILQAVK